MNRYLVTKIMGYCKTYLSACRGSFKHCGMVKTIPYNSKNALTGLQ